MSKRHKEPHLQYEGDDGKLGENCGHHCGIITVGQTDQHEAHCNCKECHNGKAPKVEIPTALMPGNQAGDEGVDLGGIK